MSAPAAVVEVPLSPLERAAARFRAEEERLAAHHAQARNRRRRQLAVGDSRLWRCHGCGAWRFALNTHFCPPLTSGGTS